MGGIQYTQNEKQEAVIALCTRSGDAQAVARDYGVTRETLYNWKNDLLGKGESSIMPKGKNQDQSLSDDRDTLLAEVETLKRQIRRLKMEKDIYEKAAEIIKKTRASTPTPRRQLWPTP